MPKNWILIAALIAGKFVFADTEECDPTKRFVFGCDPIEPLYQVRIKLAPKHGPITLAYWQTPYPVGMTPTGGPESCQYKKSYEAMYSATTSDIAETVAFGAIGSEIKVTNLGLRPVKVEFTGTTAGEPLAKGESKKFSLTTAAEDQVIGATIPLWKIWQIPEKKKGKTICSREAKKRRLKAQVVTLKVQTEEAGMWEESAAAGEVPPAAAAPAVAIPAISPVPTP